MKKKTKKELKELYKKQYIQRGGKENARLRMRAYRAKKKKENAKNNKKSK